MSNKNDKGVEYPTYKYICMEQCPMGKKTDYKKCTLTLMMLNAHVLTKISK